MGDIRYKLTRKLSSGQMSRLTLAKALMTEPKVLFLDEPTASLDPDIVNKIKAFLKEYQRTAGLSILYTSHNMREMEEMSNRIIFLQHGHIVAEGTVRPNCSTVWPTGFRRSLFEISEGAKSTMNLGRIGGLLSRHLYLYKRSFARMLEIFYWPFLDLVVWGFITMYLKDAGVSLHGAVAFFLGALILWDVLFRAQQGDCRFFFRRNVGEKSDEPLFASPFDRRRILWQLDHDHEHHESDCCWPAS